MKTIPKTFKIKLSQTLVRSEHCYKGPFETIDELLQLDAYEGDYADCYETDSRWLFINDAWTNTHQPIPEDPRYALESDVSEDVAPNTIAKRDDAGSLSVAAPTSTLHATNKEYVDNAVDDLQQQITENDNATSQSIEQLRSDLDDEINRATSAEAALTDSISGLSQQIQNETNRAQAAEQALSEDIDNTNTALQNEVDRAKQAEAALQSSVEAETSRAEGAENALNQRVNELSSTVQANDSKQTAAVQAEQARAQQAEQALQQSVNEKLSMQSATTTLPQAYIKQANGNQSMQDIDTAQTPNTLALRDGSGRLKTFAPASDNDAATKHYVDAAVEQIDAEAVALQTALNNEIERATNAEAENAKAIAEESAARQSADAALQDDIDAEVSARTQAISELTDSLSNETHNRETADATLQSAIDAEIERAKNAEQANAQAITDESNTRQQSDQTLQKNIDAEATARANADTALQNALDDESERAIAAETANAKSITDEVNAREQAVQMINTTLSALQSGKLDKTFANAVVTGITYSYSTSDDSSKLVINVINPTNNQQSTINVILPKATSSQPGLMTKESVKTLSQLISRVSALEGKQFRYLYTTSANPTADDINTFVLAQGEVAPFSGVEVIVEATKHIWRYYQNDSIGWRDDGIDTVSIASQTQIGVVQGSTEDGKIFVEDNGTMSLNGYDNLIDSDDANAQAIAEESQTREQAVNAITATLEDIQTGKLDKTFATNVVTNIVYTYNSASDMSALTVSLVNPSNKQTSSITITLPKASATQAGLMSKSDFAAFTQLLTRVSALENKQYRYIYTAKASPSASEIDAFVTEQGGTAPFYGVSVIVEATNRVWHYYEDEGVWKDDGIDTVEIATASKAGIVKSSSTNGKIAVASDGTMSMNGYDALVTADSTNTQAIADESNRAKQAEQTNASAAANALSVANSKYTKPSGGIPETDLSSDVQMKLNESGGTTVEANPTDAATAVLQSIKIGANTFSIPKGAKVVDLGTFEFDGTSTGTNMTATISLTSEQLQELLGDEFVVIKATNENAGTLLIPKAVYMPSSGGAEGSDNAVFMSTGIQEGNDAVSIMTVVSEENSSAIITFKIVALEESMNVVDLGTITLSNNQCTFTLTSEQSNAIRQPLPANIRFTVIDSDNRKWNLLQRIEYASTNTVVYLASLYSESKIQVMQLQAVGTNATITNSEISIASQSELDNVSQSVAELSDTVSAHTSNTNNPHNVTKSQVGLGNVDNVKQYSTSNPPPYPVTSVNNKTGAVTLAKTDVGLGNVANVLQYSANNPPPYPVASVAGRTGAVVLTKTDVGLSNVDNVKQYSTSNPPPYPVTSVAGRTGAVVLTKADVGLNNVANERQYSASNPPALLKGQDTRNANDPPSTYMSKGSAVVVNEFKITSVVGANSVLSGEYCQVTTYNPWTDNTGGYPVQIATSSFSNGAIAVRTGTSDTAWGPWHKVYTTGNKPTASDVGAQATITKALTSGTAYLLGSNSVTGSLGSTVYTNTAVYISSGTRINATTFSANSDKRLKKHIKRASFDETRSILDVPIKSYEWKDTGEKAVGFIAQELEKVYPELVITEESGYKSIKESKFIYYLMHEVKKLKDEVQTLKAKLGE